jgi:hypothetical protein
MKKIAAIKFKTEYPRIYLTTKSIYFTDSNVFGQISGNELKLIKDFSDLLRTVSLRDKYFYLEDYFENKREGSIYYIENDSFVELPILLDFRLIFGNDVYFLLTNKSVPQTLLFDIEKKEVIWKIDKYFSFQIFENELLIDTEKNKIIRYDFHTGDPLWQYTLLEGKYDWEDGGGYAHKGEVERIIGIHESILWVSLNSGRLLGLSIENGKLHFNISQPNQYPNAYVFREENKYLWYGRHWQLDTEKGVLFGLTSCYYFELDFNNPNETFALYDISAICEQHHIKANMAVLEWSWQGDEIFFGDTDFDKGPSYIGIFNRKTREITWTSRELGEDGVFKGINKIDYQDNRLYVLDRASTLHIFEESPA